MSLSTDRARTGPTVEVSPRSVVPYSTHPDPGLPYSPLLPLLPLLPRPCSSALRLPP